MPAYAGELNQVWTNLIVNALDAMAGHGTLTLRTRVDEQAVRLEEQHDQQHDERERQPQLGRREADVLADEIEEDAEQRARR